MTVAIRYMRSALLATMLLLSAFGCGKQPEAKAKKPKKPPLVKVAKAERTTLQKTLDVTGEVVATNMVTLRTTVVGPVGYCPWREGDRIEKAGAKLVEIDRPVYRQELAAAQAALAVQEAKLADLLAGARPEEIAQADETVTQLQECEAFAKKDMERIKEMVHKGSLPGEEHEKARVAYVTCRTRLVAAQEKLAMLKRGPTPTEVAVQKALVEESREKVQLAQAKLDECVIAAPFAGLVTQVYVRPGDVVNANADLLEMLDSESLVVRFAVPEQYSAQVRVGTPVALRFDALGDQRFQGEVSRLYANLDTATRTRTMEAKVKEPVGLIAGQFARVQVVLKSVPDAIVVPDSAVLVNAKGQEVLFVLDEGKARQRQVQTGIEHEHKVQIVEGLAAGEPVIVAGNERLKDGAPVRLPGAGKGAKSGSKTGKAAK